ncbi:hypothetical protein GEMRC1_007254 [Eukaryota sp. GEM-RC1]
MNPAFLPDAVVNLVYWTKPLVSGLAVLVGCAVYLLWKLGGASIISILSVMSFVYLVLGHLKKRTFPGLIRSRTSSINDHSQNTISSESFHHFLLGIQPLTNRLCQLGWKIFTFKDTILTMKATSICLIMYVMGTHITGITIFFAVFLITMFVPKLCATFPNQMFFVHTVVPQQFCRFVDSCVFCGRRGVVRCKFLCVKIILRTKLDHFLRRIRILKSVHSTTNDHLRGKRQRKRSKSSSHYKLNLPFLPDAVINLIYWTKPLLSGLAVLVGCAVYLLWKLGGASIISILSVMSFVYLVLGHLKKRTFPGLIRSRTSSIHNHPQKTISSESFHHFLLGILPLANRVCQLGWKIFTFKDTFMTLKAIGVSLCMYLMGIHVSGLTIIFVVFLITMCVPKICATFPNQMFFVHIVVPQQYCRFVDSCAFCGGRVVVRCKFLCVKIILKTKLDHVLRKIRILKSIDSTTNDHLLEKLVESGNSYNYYESVVEVKRRTIDWDRLSSKLKNLCEEITENRVVNVSLQSNSIGPEDAIALADALTVTSSVKYIYLQRNSIGSEGAIAIADALKVNSSVTFVDLQHNSIGSEGALAIAKTLKLNSSISGLFLENNSIGSEGALAFADALNVNFSLTYINLSNNSIGSEGALAVADALKVNPSVTYINLSNNSIGCEGALAVADALKVNRSVTYINLSNNSIGCEGALAVADALKVNRTLSSLVLVNNSIRSDGATALAKALNVNSSLLFLNLDDNSIGSEGVIPIAQVQKWIRLLLLCFLLTIPSAI